MRARPPTLDREFGGLDFLVHGAAFAPAEALDNPFVETTREGFRIALDVSAYSLVGADARRAPLMERRGGGSILTLTYLGSQRVFTNYNVMGVAKAALESSVRYLAGDLGPQNIRVNAISAGPIKTLAAAGISGFSSILQVYRERAPLRRNVELGEVADAAAVPARARLARHHRRDADGRRRLPRRRHLGCTSSNCVRRRHGSSRQKIRWGRLLAVVVAVAILLPLGVAACGKSVGETIDDATITARVKTALLNDPQVAGLKIDVDTTLGVVTMSGVVKSQSEAQRAVQLARGITGVKDVKSTLQVNPSQP